MCCYASQGYESRTGNVPSLQSMVDPNRRGRERLTVATTDPRRRAILSPPEFSGVMRQDPRDEILLWRMGTSRDAKPFDCERGKIPHSLFEIQQHSSSTKATLAARLKEWTAEMSSQHETKRELR